MSAWVILSRTQSGTNGKWRVNARRGSQVAHVECYSEAEALAVTPATIVWTR